MTKRKWYVTFGPPDASGETFNSTTSKSLSVCSDTNVQIFSFSTFCPFVPPAPWGIQRLQLLLGGPLPRSHHSEENRRRVVWNRFQGQVARRRRDQNLKSHWPDARAAASLQKWNAGLTVRFHRQSIFVCLFFTQVHISTFCFIFFAAGRPVTSTFCSSWATWPSLTLQSSRSGAREAACTGTCTWQKPSLTLCAALTWPGRRHRAWSKNRRFPVTRQFCLDAKHVSC